MPVKTSMVRGVATLLGNAGEAFEVLSDSHLAFFKGLATDLDEAPYVRLAAAISLVELGGGAYVEPALLLFAQIGSECKEKIADYVPWSIGCEGSLTAMSRVLSSYPQTYLSWLLGLLPHPDFSETETRTVMLWKIQEVCQMSRSATRVAVPYLVHLLTDEDEEVRTRVARHLPEMGRAKWLARQKLRSLQDNPDEEVQTLAAEILRKFQEVERKVEEMVAGVLNPKIQCDLETRTKWGQLSNVR